jgi:hypothetical protein
MPVKSAGGPRAIDIDSKRDQNACVTTELRIHGLNRLDQLDLTEVDVDGAWSFVHHGVDPERHGDMVVVTAVAAVTTVALRVLAAWLAGTARRSFRARYEVDIVGSDGSIESRRLDIRFSSSDAAAGEALQALTELLNSVPEHEE